MRAVWGKHFPYEIKELQTQYGEVVRVAPNELPFANPVDWDDVYSNVDGANPVAFNRCELWHGNLELGPFSVLTTIEFKAHGRIRRFMDPAFSEKAALQQESILQSYVSILLNKLRDRSSSSGESTVNIVE
jgi:cytochrome P450